MLLTSKRHLARRLERVEQILVAVADDVADVLEEAAKGDLEMIVRAEALRDCVLMLAPAKIAEPRWVP